MELGYHPSAIARGLSGKKMNTVAVVFYSDATMVLSANPFFSLVLDGIFAVCTREHQNTMFCSLASWGAGDEAISRICDGRSDGVLLLVPPIDCEIITKLQRREFPFVVLYANPANPDVSFVDIDCVLGARQAAEHLIRLGHRKINFIMDRRDHPYQFAADRLYGVRQAMAEAGLTLDDKDIVTITEAYTRMRNNRSGRADSTMPTAFLCLHDAYALQVLELFRNAGVRVPQDVSVVGFDDIPGATAGNPTLTTIRHNVSKLSGIATEILLKQIRSEMAEPQRETHPTELIVRHSTAPPRA